MKLAVLCPHYAPDTAPTGEVMTSIATELVARRAGRHDGGHALPTELELPPLHLLEQTPGLGILLGRALPQGRIEVRSLLLPRGLHFGRVLLREGGDALVLTFGHRVSTSEG